MCFILFRSMVPLKKKKKKTMIQKAEKFMKQGTWVWYRNSRLNRRYGFPTLGGESQRIRRGSDTLHTTHSPFHYYVPYFFCLSGSLVDLARRVWSSFHKSCMRESIMGLKITFPSMLSYTFPSNGSNSLLTETPRTIITSNRY